MLQQGAADLGLLRFRGGSQGSQGLALVGDLLRVGSVGQAQCGIDELAQLIQAEEQDVAEQAVEVQRAFAQAAQHVLHGLWQWQQVIQLDVAQAALDRVHQAEQFAQAIAILWMAFQFDQQLLAAWQLFRGIEAEILQQVAGNVGGARLGHGAVSAGLDFQYRKAAGRWLRGYD